MRRPRNDLSGQRFERLVVIRFAHFDSGNKSYWHVECDCDKTLVVAGYNLLNGHTRSCGCLRRGLPRKMRKPRNVPKRKPPRGAAWLPLATGKAALVDEKLLVTVEKYAWTEVTGYAVTHRSKKRIFLHRMVLDYDGPLWVDHINRDRLDNRKSNLRLVDPAQSRWNSRSVREGFRGVARSGNRWRARITCRDIRHDLGVFDSAEDAAKAYDVAARKLHGAFALLNFPEAP